MTLRHLIIIIMPSWNELHMQNNTQAAFSGFHSALLKFSTNIPLSVKSPRNMKIGNHGYQGD